MLSVGDLKQYVYCPRIFYFRTIQPLRPPATFLMERGMEFQSHFDRLEPRRVLSRFGFDQAERHFSRTLTSKELDLTGQADLALVGADRVAIVDVKASAAPLAENHRFQLAAYAILAEHVFLKPCPTCFALFVDRDDDEIEAVTIDEELRSGLQTLLGEMRDIVETQAFPDPTPHRARCLGCEFRNFCGDVF